MSVIKQKCKECGEFFDIDDKGMVQRKRISPTKKM